MREQFILYYDLDKKNIKIILFFETNDEKIHYKHLLIFYCIYNRPVFTL